MAEYYNITREEMIDFLEPQGFIKVDLNVFPTARGWKETRELVMEKVEVSRSPWFSVVIRIYTGIEGSQSRDVGTDAIRVTAIAKFPERRLTIGLDRRGYPVLKNRRVHRVKGWKRNLQNRINGTQIQLRTIRVCKHRIPMIMRDGPYSKFYGSVAYPLDECTENIYER